MSETQATTPPEKQDPVAESILPGDLPATVTEPVQVEAVEPVKAEATPTKAPCRLPNPIADMNAYDARHAVEPEPQFEGPRPIAPIVVSLPKPPPVPSSDAVLTVKQIWFDFSLVPERNRYELIDPKTVDSLTRHKPKVGEVVWLADNEFRVKATLAESEGISGLGFAARVHWGTFESVPVHFQAFSQENES